MKLPIRIKIFIAVIISLAGIISYLVFRINAGQPIDWIALAFWTFLAILTESLVLRLPSGMGLSVSLAILLAALLSKGILVAVIATVFGFLFRVVKVEGKNKFAHFFNTIPYKSFFNASQSVVAIGISGIIFHILGGKSGIFSILLTIQIVISYTLINSIIMSLFFALLRRQSFIRVWISNMRGIILNVLLVGIMGIILFLAFDSYGYGAVLLFLGPLLLARFSFKQYSDLRETYLETIKAFNELTEAKDAYTGEHSSRVEIYAVALAEHLKLPDHKINNIRMAAILHDIGKIGIDDNIIKKPAGLTDSEYELIKKHPVIGADIIQKVNFLRDVSKIMRHHHERYDGKGYPSNLKMDEISVESAILSLADVYDAITSRRPYRNARSFEEAKTEIFANAGTQFDPKLAKAFIEVMEERKEVFFRDVD
jgi:putative nucleotidyltransferase with HDIG domain